MIPEAGEVNNMEDRIPPNRFDYIGDILLIGEQLRIQMHKGGLISDRRYHLRTYNCCFMGSETVDWLVNRGHATDRNTAVILMRLLQDNYILHHVVDDHQFKDEMLFYRFRKDDGTFPWHKDGAIFLKAQRICNRVKKDANVLHQEYQCDGQTFYNVFMGSDLVDWMVSNGEATSREDAHRTCREFLENDIIKHVTNDHHFKDLTLLYQFKHNFSSTGKLMDLLKTRKRESSTGDSTRTDSESSADSIPINIRRQNSDCSYNDNDTFRTSLRSSNSPPSSQPLKSVLLCKLTADEIEDPESRFIKKTIHVMSDPVGFGFVVRGNSPTYVQTVDPDGPAAHAGLKIRQYLYSVNGTNVLRKGHQDVAKLVLDSLEVDGYMILEVLTHSREVISGCDSHGLM